MYLTMRADQEVEVVNLIGGGLYRLETAVCDATEYINSPTVDANMTRIN